MKIMKLRKEIWLSVVSLVVFILLAEIILTIFDFSYAPLDVGFNLTPEYRIFEVDGNNYETKKQIAEAFLPQKFPIKKGENEIRIFILGGSSVYLLGDAEFLKNKLESELIKGKDVRIINLGGLSYGTNRLLLLFRGIVDYEPDLVILYSGHNEFEERFMKETFFKETFFSKLSNKLVTISKLYQFMSMLTTKAIEHFFPDNIKAIKEGRYPGFPSDIKLEWGITFNRSLIYDKYQENMVEMIKLAKTNEVEMIISTVAYNRMIPPFKPEDNNYNYCLILYNETEFGKAADCFDNALDSDLQPHRATKTSNEIIKEVARTNKIPLADVDGRIVSIAENEVPGFDLFVDHCHLNGGGNEALQQVFYETIRDKGLLRRPD